MTPRSRRASSRLVAGLLRLALLSLAPLSFVMSACSSSQGSSDGTKIAGGAPAGGPPGSGKGGTGGGQRGPGGAPGARGGGNWGGPSAGAAAEPLAVRTLQVEAHDLATYYRSSGTLNAKRSAEIRPMQSGIILELRAEEGDRVKAGEVLARLDAREIELQAQREAINAANAQQELTRIEAIVGLDAIAQQEIDKQRFALDQAQATTRLTAHQVSQRTVKAPFTGIITARRVQVGNLASTGTTMYDLADISTIELVLHVPELEASAIAVSTPVRIETIDKKTFEAKIIRRAPVVDATTGTVKFTASTATYPPQAVPGAFARADILLVSKKAVPSLPNSAIAQVDGKAQVLTIVDGKAKRLPVTLGLRGHERSEILEGLPADAIVVQEPGEIANGTLLKSANVATPPAPDKAAPGGAPAPKAGDSTATQATSHSG